MSLNITIQLPVASVQAIQNAARLGGDALQTARNEASQAFVDAVEQLPYDTTPKQNGLEVTAGTTPSKRISPFVSWSPQPNKKMKYEPELIQLFVRGVSGKLFCLTMRPDCRVDELKSEIERKEGIPGHEQRLIHGGRQMEDGRQLSDYGIKTAATLQLLLRLRGG